MEPRNYKGIVASFTVVEKLSKRNQPLNAYILLFISLYQYCYKYKKIHHVAFLKTSTYLYPNQQEYPNFDIYNIIPIIARSRLFYRVHYLLQLWCDDNYRKPMNYKGYLVSVIVVNNSLK